MAMFPRSLAAACSSVLELWELQTVGDVLTASTDAEVGACIPTEQKEAWDKLMVKMDQMNLSKQEKELIKQEIQHKEAELYRMS